MRTMRVATHTNPFTPALILDKNQELPSDLSSYISPSGGICIKLNGHTTLDLPASDLCSIDIIEAPFLTKVNLEKVTAGRINLSIQASPALNEVRFPSETKGHLFYHNTGSLQWMDLYGGITYLDLAWDSNSKSLRVSADNERPWCKAEIRSDPAAFTTPEQPSSTLWLLDQAKTLNGPIDNKSKVLALPIGGLIACHAETIHVLGPSTAEAFEWKGQPLQSLSLHNFSDLQAVHLGDKIDVLSLANLPKLAALSSEKRIGEIKINDSSTFAEVLSIDADYKSLNLSNSAKSLKVASDCVAPIDLQDCQGLTQVSLPEGAEVRCYGCAPRGLLMNATNYYVNEHVLFALADEISTTDGPQWERLKYLLLHCSRGTKLKAALHVLADLGQRAVNGSSTEDIWSARLALNLKNQKPNLSSQKAISTAEDQTTLIPNTWNMPPDLHRECWELNWKILEATFPVWHCKPYATVIYDTLIQNQNALSPLIVRLKTGRNLTQTSIQIALSILLLSESSPKVVKQRTTLLPSVINLAERLMQRLRKSNQGDTNTKKNVLRFLCQTLRGQDLQNFLRDELRRDPIRTRLVITERLNRLEPTKGNSRELRILRHFLFSH